MLRDVGVSARLVGVSQRFGFLQGSDDLYTIVRGILQS